MKKIFIAIAALVCCCFSASAQFSLGFGYCNSAFQEKMASVESDRTYGNGLFVEAGYDARINPYFSILTKAEAGNWFNGGEFKKGNHYYAKVPVLAKLIFASDMDFKLFLDLGPEFFWHFAENPSEKLDFSFSGVYAKSLLPYNLYATIGLGCDLSNRIRAHIGYERSVLNDYSKEHRNYVSGMGNVLDRNTADFTVSVAYLF